MYVDGGENAKKHLFAAVSCVHNDDKYDDICSSTLHTYDDFALCLRRIENARMTEPCVRG